MNRKKNSFAREWLLALLIFSAVLALLVKIYGDRQKSKECSNLFSKDELERINNSDFSQIFLQPRFIDRHSRVTLCVSHITGFVEKNYGSIKSARVYRNGELYEDKLKDFYIIEERISLTGPTDFLLVYETENGIFISEPLLVRTSSTPRVSVEDNIEIGTDKKEKGSVSEKDFLIANKNLEKLLRNLTYVVIDKNLSKETIKDVKLSFNNEAEKVVIYTTDNKTLVQDNLNSPYVTVKFSSAFNNHEFFWDDEIMSWYFVNTLPELTKSTLDFWYRLQIKEGDNKGLIPREIRPEKVSSQLVSPDYINVVNPVSYIPLSSKQISNPFFLSEIELEIYEIFKDGVRLEDKYPLLKEYFFWVERKKKSIDKGTNCPFYEFSNLGSGMDNIGRDGGVLNRKMNTYGWVDLFAQQVMLAQNLAEIENILKMKDDFLRISKELKSELLRCQFDDSSGLFLDRDYVTHEFAEKPKTIAPFWVLMVEFEKEEQNKYLSRFLGMLSDESEFGGYPPLPSVSRRDISFGLYGNYWQGGVWPPMVWVVTKGLEKNGYYDEAKLIKQNMYRLMREVYDTRGTVFEYYAPSLIEGKPFPGRLGDYEAKSDFYGWGSLIIPLALGD